MLPFSPGQLLDLAAALGAALFGALVALVPALAPLGEYAAPSVAFAFAGAAFMRFVASVRASANADPFKSSTRPLKPDPSVDPGPIVVHKGRSYYKIGGPDPDQKSERGHSQLRIMAALLLAVIAGSLVAVGCAQLDRLSRAADAYCEKDKAPDGAGSSTGEAGSSDESALDGADPGTGSGGAQ